MILEMTDEYAQYLVAMYELCLAARLGDLRVGFNCEAEERVVGVPVILEPLEPDWPYVGTSAVIAIDDSLINLANAATCTIFAPSASGPH